LASKTRWWRKTWRDSACSRKRAGRVAAAAVVAFRLELPARLGRAGLGWAGTDC
jgi:hypothetical protein